VIMRSQVLVSAGNHCIVTSGKLLTPMCLLSPSSIIWYGREIDTPRDALAPYLWSRSVSWCLAEGSGKGGQHHPVGCVVRWYSG